MTKLPAHHPAETLRKLNEDIGPIVKFGDFGLLHRKLYNCLLHHAQRSGLSGRGRIPVGVNLGDRGGEDNLWWMPLDALIADAAYDSKATDLVKEALQDLQKTLLVRDTGVGRERDWSSEQVIGTVNLRNDRNAKGGGRIWVGFSFVSESMTAQILNPESSFTLLSVFYQTELRTEAAVVLYEMCRRYATCPGGRTPIRPWEEWKGRLCSKSPAIEYRYFKRDYLARAMREVNEVTNLEVMLLEFKEGRRISKIGFAVEFKTQGSLPIETIPKLESEVQDIMRLMSVVGLSRGDATRAFAGPNADLIDATIAMLEDRLRQDATTIISPAAWFKKALAERWADGEKARNEAKKVTAAKAEKKRQLQIKHSDEQVLAAAQTSDIDAEKAETRWPEFRRSLAGKLARSETYSAASERDRKAFAAWLSATVAV